MSRVEIRPADLYDADTIALFETHVAFAIEQSPSCAKHSFDVAQLRAPSVTVWCAWLADPLVGGGALRELDASHGQIKAMHTLASVRGAGVGEALLRHIEAEAARRGYQRLSLETGTQDGFAAARRLYVRHGFTECPPFAAYEADPEVMFMTRLVGH